MILPSFTIISCILPIIRCGAVPILVDSDPVTWNMDVKKIENIINSERAMAKKGREDEIKSIEESIRFKREMAKHRREDEIKKIEDTIGSKRKMAKQRREDQIILYEEAADIASKLEIGEKVDTTNILTNSQLNISTASIPLYYRGFRALNNEIKLLKNRKSDDPFIPGLRDLQENLTKLRNRKSDDPFIFGLRELQVKVDQLRSIKSDYTFFAGLRGLQENLALLRSIKIDEEGQHAVIIDQAAYSPKSIIKPKRRLIVTISTMVGLILGIFLVYTISFIQKQKLIHSA